MNEIENGIFVIVFDGNVILIVIDMIVEKVVFQCFNNIFVFYKIFFCGKSLIEV